MLPPETVGCRIEALQFAPESRWEEALAVRADGDPESTKAWLARFCDRRLGVELFFKQPHTGGLRAFIGVRLDFSEDAGAAGDRDGIFRACSSLARNICRLHTCGRELYLGYGRRGPLSEGGGEPSGVTYRLYLSQSPRKKENSAEAASAAVRWSSSRIGETSIISRYFTFMLRPAR